MAAAGQSAAGHVAPRTSVALCAPAYEPVVARGGSATWRTCDGRFVARFDYGAGGSRGPAYVQTSASIGMPARAAIGGGPPALLGTVPLAYFELASFSAGAAVTYTAPSADRSLIESLAIARGASYEIVGYERAPFGPNATFRVVYQSAAYVATSAGVLDVKSPLAGLIVPRATSVYFTLLSVPFLAAVPPAQIERPQVLEASTACRGKIGTAFDPNPGSFASNGTAQRPGLPCFADFSEYAGLPASAGGAYTLAFATSTDKMLGSVPSTSCGSFAAPCGTPIFFASIKPNVAVRFALASSSLGIGLSSPSAISLANQYAASLYDLGLKKTIESLAFIRSSSALPDKIAFNIPLAALPATGVVLIVYRQPLLPSLTLAKIDNGGTTGWTIGQSEAAYALTASNAGKRATSGTITVRDTLPRGITLRGAPSGKGWVCTGTPPSVTLSCTSTIAIPPGASGAAITVPVDVGAMTPVGEKSIANTASAFGGGDPLHATATHAVSASDSTTVTGIPMLAVSKTDNGGAAGWTIGQTGAAYTLTVSNRGSRATSGTITVSDSLPNGLVLSGAPSGTGWICTGTSGSAALSCFSTTAIAANASGAPITVPVHVGPTTSTGTKAITNTASAYGGGDPTHVAPGSAVTASDSTTVTGIPVLALSKSDNGGTAGWTIGQSGAAYTLTVGNRGSGATSGTIAVSDTLPSGLTLSAAASGTGWTCTGPAGSSSLACTSTTPIAKNASGASIVVPVEVGATTPTGTDAIANTASAFGGGDPVHATAADPAKSNVDTTTVKGVPTLTLGVTDDGPFGVDLIPAGQQSPAARSRGGAPLEQTRWSSARSPQSTDAGDVRRPHGQTSSGPPRYTISVGNAQTATGATSGPIFVSFVLPGGVAPNGQPGASDGSWACTNTSGSQFSCVASASIAAGSSASPIEVPITIGPSVQPGTLTLSVAVYGGGDPAHATSSNSLNATDVATVNGPTSVFLTGPAMRRWLVPLDFNPYNNLIEVIGGGGASSCCGGGGGGAYSAVANASLAPGSSLAVAVGAAGQLTENGSTNGGDTYLCPGYQACELSGSIVGAQGGGAGPPFGGSLGGDSSFGIGTTLYSGGHGGGGCVAGGGAAAGRFSNGAAGGDATCDDFVGSGGGGGGADGGQAGNGPGLNFDAGAGGNGPGGSGASPGGAGGTNLNENGSPGTNGGGGGGGYDCPTCLGGFGGVGGNGSEFDAAHGSGGGGGGAAGSNSRGGDGGDYGGGAGTGGSAARGIIAITYTSTGFDSSNQRDRSRPRPAPTAFGTRLRP